MNVLAILLVVVASLLVFVLAAVVIGREARRLDAVAPRTVYDLSLIHISEPTRPY